MKKKVKNLIIVGMALILVSGVFLYFYFQRKGKSLTVKGNIVSSQEAAQRAIEYINNNLLVPGVTASLLEVSEEDEVYKIHIKIGGNEYDSYISKDGKYLFPEGYDLTLKKETEKENAEEKDVEKVEKPDVKLFVMSYCPFGLQAEKMFLPVYNLLKDKAEMGVYFVNYIMHDKKELDENLRQYCIQKEEKEKYYDYLSCFIEDGNFDKCLDDANINRGKLRTCIEDTDKQYNIYAQYEDKNTWLNGRFPKFDVHTDLNQKYGVRGSPTVVVNDKVVQVNPRSPEKFKEIVCASFSSAPQECSETLSDKAFSPGFGFKEGEGSSGGGCGQ